MIGIERKIEKLMVQIRLHMFTALTSAKPLRA